MVIVYIFEASIVRMGNRYYIYLPKEYQNKIAKLHGKKIKIIAVIGEEQP